MDARYFLAPPHIHFSLVEDIPIATLRTVFLFIFNLGISLNIGGS